MRLLFLGMAVVAIAASVSSNAHAEGGCLETAQVIGLNAEAGGLLNVRSGPGREHQAIGQIRLGDVVEACGFFNGWTQISYAAGSFGWVSSRFLAPIDESAGTTISGMASEESATGFRVGEVIERQPPSQYSDGYTSHSGETFGLFYRYYSDGSGSLSDSPDILKPALWKVKCATDAMSDVRSCTIHDEGGTIFLHLTSKTKFGVCAMGHDFPGRTAMIRLDKDAPISLGEGGCSDPDGLSAALRKAAQVTVRSYKWPNDWSRDQTLDLRGLDTAFDLAAYLRDRE